MNVPSRTLKDDARRRGRLKFGEEPGPCCHDRQRVPRNCFALAERSEMSLVCSPSRSPTPTFNIPGLQPTWSGSLSYLVCVPP